MNVRKIQQEAYRNAVQNGFQDRGETFGDRMALVHSEISQAFECYRAGMRPEPGLIHSTSGHPMGIPIELADIVLTTAGICQNYGMDLQDGIENTLQDETRQDPERQADPGSLAALQRLVHQRLRLEGETSSFGHLMAKCHQAASRAMTTSELPGAFDRGHWLAAPEVHRPGILTDLSNIAIWAMAAAHHHRIQLDEPIRVKMEFNRTRPDRHGRKAL